MKVERRVLKGSLHTVPEVQNLFTCHKLEWMARSLETYREKVVREFYAAYVAILRVLYTGDGTCQIGTTHRSSSSRLTGRHFFTFIRSFLYGVSTSAARVPLTPKFDYR